MSKKEKLAGYLKKKFGKHTSFSIYEGKKFITKARVVNGVLTIKGKPVHLNTTYTLVEEEETKKDYRLRIASVLLGVCLLVGLVMSSIAPYKNIDLLYTNTKGIQNDLSLKEVTDIGVDESITLSNGTIIQGEDVEGFVKVRISTGTWFITEKNWLIVEVTPTELVISFLPFLAYFVGLQAYVLIRSLKRIMKWSRAKLIGFMLLDMASLYLIGMLVEELLH